MEFPLKSAFAYLDMTGMCLQPEQLLRMYINNIWRKHSKMLNASSMPTSAVFRFSKLAASFWHPRKAYQVNCQTGLLQA